MNILVPVFLITISNLLPPLQGATDLYTFKLKYIKCTDIDPDHIQVVNCYVKAVRHKFGLLFLEFEQRNMNNYHTSFKMFYQNSAGRYLPFFINYEYDFCEWEKLEKSGSKIFELGRAIDSKYATCPFNVRRTFAILAHFLT